MLDHGREEVQDLWVASIVRVRLVVIDQKLKLRQELLVEDSVSLILLLQDVGLDQLENVASDSLHRFEHRDVACVLVHDES